MRKLILDDIIGVISENQLAGNITAADANKLCGLIRKLYNHLYAHYKELIEGGLNDMMDEGLVLEADIFEAEVTKRNQRDTIRKIYSKHEDEQWVADLLDLSLDVVKKALEPESEKER